MRNGVLNTASTATVTGTEGMKGCDRDPVGSVWLLYHLACWARRRSAVHSAADLRRTTDRANYRSWRLRELRQQLHDHFDVSGVSGRDVLDFGCGTGELCTVLASCGPGSLTGVDKSAEAISRAIAAKSNDEAPEASRPRFVCNERTDRLPLDDTSIDLICCFDVLEHIISLEAILGEWRRVLRPGGRVWIWWSPWRGPWGHHIESLIPLPWVHLLFSERTLLATCARLYDDPDFAPRIWDMDPKTGLKKPNKWRDTHSFHPFLNRLTRRTFERMVDKSCLTITRRETHGFSGSRLRRATRLLLPIPSVGGCFVSFHIYELRKQ